MMITHYYHKIISLKKKKKKHSDKIINLIRAQLRKQSKLSTELDMRQTSVVNRQWGSVFYEQKLKLKYVCPIL